MIHYLSEKHGTILKVLQFLKDNGNSDFKSFFEQLNSEQQQYVSRILVTYNENENTPTFEYLLLKFHKKIWKKITYTIKMQLAQAEDSRNDEKVEEILKKFLQLKQKFVYKNLIK